ncbi:MAG: hypothetical protein ACRD63_07220 [Pyrinomonadaceae bacterium]
MPKAAPTKTQIINETENQISFNDSDLIKGCNKYIHDLKNKLNSVKLYATLLKKRLDKHAVSVSEKIEGDEIEVVDALIKALEGVVFDVDSLETCIKTDHLKL